MKRISWSMGAWLAAVVAVTACGELTGIVDNFFTLTVASPPGGGDRYGTVPGGQVTVMLRLQNGDNVRTAVTFSMTAPAGTTARVEPPSSNGDGAVVLDPNESIDVPLIVDVSGTQAPGPFSLEVVAEGTSTRTDIADGGDFHDTQTAAVGFEVSEDEGPPVVMIGSPEAGTSMSSLPVSGSVLVTDDATIVDVTYKLNDDPARTIWTRASSGPPTVSVDVPFDLTDDGGEITSPLLGANTLLVTARDAAGQTGSASVEFNYQPTGQCQYFLLEPAVERIVSDLMVPIGVRVLVTPLAGWSGQFRIEPVDRQLFVSSSIRAYSDVTGATAAYISGTLSDDLVPGQTYDLAVRVDGLTEPESACEMMIPIDVVEAGLGAPPVVSIVSPPENHVTSDPSLTFTASVTDDGTIKDVYYHNELDRQGVVLIRTTDTPSPFSFTETIPLVLGDNLIRVTALDNEGRLSSHGIIVTYEPDGGGQCSQFTIEASPGEMAAAPGATEYAGILINRIGGFDGAVQLSIEEPFATSLFDNIAFEPNPTSSNSTMALTVTNGASAIEFIGNTYQFTVVGTAESSTCATTFTMEVLDG